MKRSISSRSRAFIWALFGLMLCSGCSVKEIEGQNFRLREELSKEKIVVENLRRSEAIYTDRLLKVEAELRDLKERLHEDKSKFNQTRDQAIRIKSLLSTELPLESLVSDIAILDSLVSSSPVNSTLSAIWTQFKLETDRALQQIEDHFKEVGPLQFEADKLKTTLMESSAKGFQVFVDANKAEMERFQSECSQETAKYIMDTEARLKEKRRQSDYELSEVVKEGNNPENFFGLGVVGKAEKRIKYNNLVSTIKQELIEFEGVCKANIVLFQFNTAIKLNGYKERLQNLLDES